MPWDEMKVLCLTETRLQAFRPWLVPLFECANSWPSANQLNSLAKEKFPAFDWQFREQLKTPRRKKSSQAGGLSHYVRLIAVQREIPFRHSNIHDFFNALSFFAFPKSKAALNDRHVSEAPNGVEPGSNRSRTQDLLTLLDEGGMVTLNDLKGESSDFIFGHAIAEHLILKKGVRAARLQFNSSHLLRASNPVEVVGVVDECLSGWIQDRSKCLSSQEFSHIVV